MKNILSNSKNTQKSHEDIEGIKSDIASLVHRLGNIKDNARDVISDQLDNLTMVITNFKDKAYDVGRDNLKNLSNSTKENPLRNLAYAFGIGILLSIFVKR